MEPGNQEASPTERLSAKVTAELRARLRGGSGLSAAKLEQCPHLLQALGTDDADEAVRRLRQALVDLGPGPDADALRAATNVSPVLGGSLKSRREAFAVRHGNRLPETIELWENRAIEALVNALMVRKSTLAGVEVSAVYLNGKLGSLSIFEYYESGIEGEQDQRRIFNERAVAHWQPQLPYVVIPYFVPHDKPAPGVLVIAASFEEDPYPEKCFAIEGATLFDVLSHGIEMFEVEPLNTTSTAHFYAHQFDSPQHDLLYLLIMRFNPEVVERIRKKDKEEEERPGSFLNIVMRYARGEHGSLEPADAEVQIIT